MLSNAPDKLMELYTSIVTGLLESANGDTLHTLNVLIKAKHAPSAIVDNAAKTSYSVLIGNKQFYRALLKLRHDYPDYYYGVSEVWLHALSADYLHMEKP